MWYKLKLIENIVDFFCFFVNNSFVLLLPFVFNISTAIPLFQQTCYCYYTRSSEHSFMCEFTSKATLLLTTCLYLELSEKPKGGKEVTKLTNIFLDQTNRGSSNASDKVHWMSWLHIEESEFQCFHKNKSK